MTNITSEYKLDLSTFWGVTGLQLITEMAPNDLYERFGYPVLNDRDGESLGTYVFVSSSGDVVTIYYRAFGSFFYDCSKNDSGIAKIQYV